MEFEWDEAKNRTNIRRHGFDFAEAWEVFNGPLLADMDKREDYGEERWIGLGLLRGIAVVIVFTQPASDLIRVISLRKATKKERRGLTAILDPHKRSKPWE